MDIEYILQMLNNRMSVLNNGKALAFNSGDMEAINKIDADIISTQNSITQLLLLQTINNAASAANTTPAEMVASGIETAQNAASILDASAGIMAHYDITTYATDPLHEQKIADILESMGEMDSPAVIDAYIDKEAIESPVTAAMILSAASKYGVDVRLMMAIMELDSRFGTAGVAIRTLNPGNVGNNDDGDTRTYSSWDEGVEAVAEWLSRHRIAVPIAEVLPEIVVPPPPEVEATPPETSTSTEPLKKKKKEENTTASSTESTTASSSASTETETNTATSTPEIVPELDTSTTTAETTTPVEAATTTPTIPDEPVPSPIPEPEVTPTPIPEVEATPSPTPEVDTVSTPTES